VVWFFTSFLCFRLLCVSDVFSLCSCAASVIGLVAVVSANKYKELNRRILFTASMALSRPYSHYISSPYHRSCLSKMHSILTKISSGTSRLQHRIISEIKLPTLLAQGILTRWQTVWTYHAADRCWGKERTRVELNYLLVWNNKHYSNVYVSMTSLFMASPLRTMRWRVDAWKQKQMNIQCLSGYNAQMPSAPNNSRLVSSTPLKYNFPKLC
jgi:hypothetical protein